MVPDFHARLVETIPHTNRFLARKAHQAGLQAAEISDLQQDTLLKALKNGAKYIGTRPMRPWLNTIAINLLRDRLDKLKTLKKRKFVSIESTDADGNLLVELPDRRGSSDQDKAVNVDPWEDPTVQSVLAVMQPQHQTVVRKMLAGAKNKAIACEVGLSANTVGTILHRFRGMMKEALGM